MSKSKPTQHRAMSHIIMGPSRAYLKIFLRGRARMRTNRKKDWLGSLEGVDGEGLPKESAKGLNQNPHNHGGKRSAGSSRERHRGSQVLPRLVAESACGGSKTRQILATGATVWLTCQDSPGSNHGLAVCIGLGPFSDFREAFGFSFTTAKPRDINSGLVYRKLSSGHQPRSPPTSDTE